MSRTTTQAIDSWCQIVFNDFSDSRQQQLIRSLKQELPSMLSVVFERTCNLQCAHCLYPQDLSSQLFSKQNKFDQVVPSIARQLPPANGTTPSLLHEGRIVQPWHLDVLAEIKKIRPDIELGLIENGSYTRLLDEFKKRNLRLDWLDISLDGLKDSHNQQRDPVLKRSWDQTSTGLQQAHEITKPGARVSVLMTVTKLNYQDIAGLADFVFGQTFADEFHVVPMSPKLPLNKVVDSGIAEWQIIWQQVSQAWKKHNREKQKFFFKLYRLEDLEKLARVIGAKKIWQALTKNQSSGYPVVDQSSITFMIDETIVTYYPTSIWPQESFLIDADACARVAYAQQFTLQQLRASPHLAQYTVAQLTPQSNYQKIYALSVDHWWQHFGQDFLQKEVRLFNALNHSERRQ